MQGNLQMSNYSIVNLKDPVNNQGAATKKYVDDEIAKRPASDTSGLLPIDGSKAMTGDLNMGTNAIIGIKKGDNLSGAVNLQQLIDTLTAHDDVIDKNTDKKILDYERRAIDVVDQENVFKPVIKIISQMKIVTFTKLVL